MADETPLTADAPPPAAAPRGSWLDRLSERNTVLLLLLFGVLLYIPFAGSYGLWDPWETHYGEVARQMVKRGDYISLYWPGSPLDREYFWSKPVLTFWVMALSLVLAGFGADTPPGAFATGTGVEWAMRVPFCLLALTALYGVYLLLSRLVNRRAGLLGAVALSTMPMFSLIARQAMTDMPFVGPMTLALALGVIALLDDDERELPRRTLGRLSWPHHPVFYVAVALVTLTAVPQLVIDSVQLVWRFRMFGKRFALPGVLPMLPYVLGYVAFLYWTARARVRAPLYLVTAGALCALAVLAKGLAGLGLPVIILLVFVTVSGNWHRFKRPQLSFGVLVAILACAVIAVPWHHAMLIRHGSAFWSELYGDNHWKRMVAGRHGDRGAFDYFLREGAYAILPWVPIVPAALAWAIGPRLPADAPSLARQRRHGFWLGILWAGVAYIIVSLSMTKFHHYILPALPGVAVAVGCLLDHLLDTPRPALGRLTAFVGVPLLALVTFDLARSPKAAERFLWLFSYDYVNDPNGRAWPDGVDFAPTLMVFAILIGLVTLTLSWGRLRRFAVTGLLLLSVAFTFVLLDDFLRKTSNVWSQKELIATYYRMRSSPEERLVAWQMYWRGETFYTQNEIYEGPQDRRTVFLGTRNAEDLQAFLARNPGKRMFFVVEKIRLERLRQLLPQPAQASLQVQYGGNNKFYLATAQL